MRDALHWTLLRLSVVTWLVMQAGFWLSIALVTAADRLKPHTDPLNCWTWAGTEWWRRMRAFFAEGCPEGHEPYFVIRWSRDDPKPAQHALIGDRDEDSGAMGLDSYKPTNRRPFAWWKVWRWGERLNVEGRVVRGD